MFEPAMLEGTMGSPCGNQLVPFFANVQKVSAPAGAPATTALPWRVASACAYAVLPPEGLTPWRKDQRVPEPENAYNAPLPSNAPGAVMSNVPWSIATAVPNPSFGPTVMPCELSV